MPEQSIEWQIPASYISRIKFTRWTDDLYLSHRKGHLKVEFITGVSYDFPQLEVELVSDLIASDEVEKCFETHVAFSGRLFRRTTDSVEPDPAMKSGKFDAYENKWALIFAIQKAKDRLEMHRLDGKSKASRDERIERWGIFLSGCSPSLSTKEVVRISLRNPFATRHDDGWWSAAWIVESGYIKRIKYHCCSNQSEFLKGRSHIGSLTAEFVTGVAYSWIDIDIQDVTSLLVAENPCMIFLGLAKNRWGSCHRASPGSDPAYGTTGRFSKHRNHDTLQYELREAIKVAKLALEMSPQWTTRKQPFAQKCLALVGMEAVADPSLWPNPEWVNSRNRRLKNWIKTIAEHSVELARGEEQRLLSWKPSLNADDSAHQAEDQSQEQMRRLQIEALQRVRSEWEQVKPVSVPQAIGSSNASTAKPEPSSSFRSTPELLPKPTSKSHEPAKRTETHKAPSPRSPSKSIAVLIFIFSLLCIAIAINTTDATATFFLIGLAGMIGVLYWWINTHTEQAAKPLIQHPDKIAPAYQEPNEDKIRAELWEKERQLRERQRIEEQNRLRTLRQQEKNQRRAQQLEEEKRLQEQHWREQQELAEQKREEFRRTIEAEAERIAQELSTSLVPPSAQDEQQTVSSNNVPPLVEQVASPTSKPTSEPNLGQSTTATDEAIKLGLIIPINKAHPQPDSVNDSPVDGSTHTVRAEVPGTAPSVIQEIVQETTLTLITAAERGTGSPRTSTKKTSQDQETLSPIKAEPAVEELDEPLTLDLSPSVEGRRKLRKSYQAVRNPKLREMAIQIHGQNCCVCGFNFDQFFGESISRGYVEVHHLNSIAEGERTTNPETDLAPLCANCHAMADRLAKKLENPPSSIEELKAALLQNR